MWGSAARESSQTARTFTLKVSSHCSSGNLLGAPNVQDPRVVQQKVQTAEAPHRLIQQVFNFARSGNVDWDREGRISNFVSNLFDAIPSPADQRHLRSFPRQSDRACAANSSARTSDDPNLALQTFTHDEPV